MLTQLTAHRGHAFYHPTYRPSPWQSLTLDVLRCPAASSFPSGAFVQSLDNDSAAHARMAVDGAIKWIDTRHRLKDRFGLLIREDR